MKKRKNGIALYRDHMIGFGWQITFALYRDGEAIYYTPTPLYIGYRARNRRRLLEEGLEMFMDSCQRQELLQ